MNKFVFYISIFVISALGLWFNLYHIEFGLPHSFHADEPEIIELAIKYTFDLKDILANTELYRLTPISYVYGSFPVYLFTIATVVYSKLNSVLGLVFSKMDIYVFLRSLTALITVTLVPIGILTYQNLFPRSTTKYLGGVLFALFCALNWKLIVHAHYVNADILITVLLSASYLCFIKYLDKEDDTLFTVLTGIFFGLAVGTKVTVLITLPIYLYLFIKKGHVRNMFAFLFVIFGVFIVTNPFSFVFANDFAFRVLQLSVKENGLVFDSVDFGIFKYVFGLSSILTPTFLLLSLLGVYISLKEKVNSSKHLFFLLHLAVYIIFFSIGSRRVDRWLLPIIPVFIMYGVYSLEWLIYTNKKFVYIPLVVIVLVNYLYFPMLLLTQFNEQTPKSAAYLWMRDNLTPASNKLVITEEGLDPMNKLLSSYVLKYEVYEAENAQFRMPENPLGYDYVVLSSRPMQNFKRPEVANKFPFYNEAWTNFENTVLDPAHFTMIRSFELPKPNLIDVSDVYIFERVSGANPSSL